jgi:hypothetical protein
MVAASRFGLAAAVRRLEQVAMGEHQVVLGSGSQLQLSPPLSPNINFSHKHTQAIYSLIDTFKSGNTEKKENAVEFASMLDGTMCLLADLVDGTTSQIVDAQQ